MGFKSILPSRALILVIELDQSPSSTKSSLMCSVSSLPSSSTKTLPRALGTRSTLFLLLPTLSLVLPSTKEKLFPLVPSSNKTHSNIKSGDFDVVFSMLNSALMLPSNGATYSNEAVTYKFTVPMIASDIQISKRQLTLDDDLTVPFVPATYPDMRAVPPSRSSTERRKLYLYLCDLVPHTIPNEGREREKVYYHSSDIYITYIIA